MSEFGAYIGIPWQEGAAGPDAYDCMSFVAEVQRRHFGIVMPRITIPDYDDVRQLVRLINGHAENEHWQMVAAPRHGDIVFIRHPAHYGVWLDVDGGGVLHCSRWAGVVFNSDSSWHTSGFGRKQYLRHRSRA
ncbi:NlpC/P60 family protein [Desulfobulbus elongatus]|uniref:NlpC/P60 family protein n=1 Tax=Desulfobulbus elongatus TaxID=53332 RepID=UPI000556C0C9|nr:NlpC/P60 family protein [Desulfobulbus elongatus]